MADSFEAGESGIFLPTPSGEEIRQLLFFGGLGLEVRELPEEIVKRIGHARKSALEWVEFTDASFGTVIRVPMTAINRLAWVATAWKDMSAAREQIRQMELARKARGSGLAIAQTAPTPLPSRAARRRG